MSNNFNVCKDCEKIYYRSNNQLCDVCNFPVCCPDCIGFNVYTFENFIYLLCDECCPQKLIKKTSVSYHKNKEYNNELLLFEKKVQSVLTTREIDHYPNPIPLKPDNDDYVMPILKIDHC